MIEIWAEELPTSWQWHPENFCGGTHEFVVETAGVLAKMHEVVVYYDGKTTNHKGAYYFPRRYFKGNDIVLSCNSHAPRRGRHSIYWTSWFKQRQEDCLQYDERIVLSKYHQSIFGENSRIVPLGCWLKTLTGGAKAKGMCLYSSSPDRGLDFLKSIWPEVEERTGAKLKHTYNSDICEADMCTLYKQAQFWLHPGQGIELFCLSAVKAQVAGCIPVVVPNMALAETVKFGVKTTLENFKEDLIATITHPLGTKDVQFADWDEVTRNLFKNTDVFAEVTA